MNIKLYRHKKFKDIYLARDWAYCGGNPDTPFYYATKDMVKALQDANKEKFTDWFNSFLDEDGNTKLTAKIVLEKEVEVDGYTGTCRKTEVFRVTDFELIEFTDERKDVDVDKAIDFLKSYAFKDKEEVYTNGAVLVPFFRVEQALRDRAYNGLCEG